MRYYSIVDRLVLQIDQGLRTLASQSVSSERAYPAKDVEMPILDEAERRHAAGLMRVNHAGEVCAQALYQGQALTARTRDVETSMKQAAQEESDHLAWCEQRLVELRSHVSYLNPIWYVGSFSMGAVAGWVGDGFSLGFVEETEQQVIQHLDKHLQKLPLKDQRSRKIIQQMREDESHHAALAKQAGAISLSVPLKMAMYGTSTLMTTIAYWI